MSEMRALAMVPTTMVKNIIQGTNFVPLPCACLIRKQPMIRKCFLRINWIHHNSWSALKIWMRWIHKILIVTEVCHNWLFPPFRRGVTGTYATPPPPQEWVDDDIKKMFPRLTSCVNPRPGRHMALNLCVFMNKYLSRLYRGFFDFFKKTRSLLP
jgi:hypothetical protein